MNVESKNWNRQKRDAVSNSQYLAISQNLDIFHDIQGGVLIVPADYKHLEG